MKTGEKPAHQLLLDAAGLIVERGHAKGVLEDSNGSVCLVGAIRYALSGSCYGGGSAATRRTVDVGDVLGLDDDYGSPLMPAVTWNNADERTPGEVIAALDAAAVVAMQEAGIEPEDVLR